MSKAAYLELIGKHARKNEEAAIQRALVQHLRLRADPRVIWFAVPNGGLRSKSAGAQLKATGVIAGVYDMVFFLPGGLAAVLELKVEGGRISPEQQRFGERCEAINVMQAVAWNIDQALDILVAWKVLPNAI